MMTDDRIISLFELAALQIGRIRGECSALENALMALRDAVYADDMLEGSGAVIFVPYRSQWDTDAAINASDCGPASLAGVLQWRGVNAKIDDLASKCGMSAAKRYTVGGDLVRVASEYGVKLQHRFDAPLSVIEAEVKAGRPAIVLLHYGTIRPYVQDKIYVAGHWLVVTGVTADSVIVNDPNFRGAERDKGFSLPIPRNVFEQAMKDNALDGNRANQAVLVTA